MQRARRGLAFPCFTSSAATPLNGQSPDRQERASISASPGTRSTGRTTAANARGRRWAEDGRETGRELTASQSVTPVAVDGTGRKVSCRA